MLDLELSTPRRANWVLTIGSCDRALSVDCGVTGPFAKTGNTWLSLTDKMSDGTSVVVVSLDRIGDACLATHQFHFVISVGLVLIGTFTGAQFQP